MVFRAYVVFLNLGASVEVREGDPATAIWACIGSMTQLIPRTFVLTEAEGRAARPVNVTSRIQAQYTVSGSSHAGGCHRWSPVPGRMFNFK